MIREHEGEQLQLSVGNGFRDGVAVPWGGLSPRVLTRGHGLFILKTQGAKSMGDFIDPAQCDLFEAVDKKAPPGYGGAPLLLEP